MTIRSLDLDIPEDAWRPWGLKDGEDSSRLGFTLNIGEVSLHLIAIEVKLDKDELQIPVDDNFGEDFDWLCSLSRPDGPFETLTVKGREYVIYAEPFCR